MALNDTTTARTIAPGVIEIDTLLGGWRETTAGYLLDAPSPVLIETGSQSSVDTVVATLSDLGIAAGDLAGIALTHIHLDHAGGVGDVAAAFPAATIYVHELGARHLADPSRLVASAERVYGSLLDSLYGRLTPTEAARIVVLRDDDTVELGPGRTLTALNSPGHAKHHLGFLDSGSGLVFAGDAVGVRLPGGGVLRPATPPADFDFDQAIASLHRFAACRPAGLALAHYGLVPTDVDTLLGEAEERLRAWVGAADAARREGRDIAAALGELAGADEKTMSTEMLARYEMLNGIHSNAAGIARFLEMRDEAPAGD
jgi:glyoxylase-like metal-dependent hydrolase (beta-lactamase superfamily II)